MIALFAPLIIAAPAAAQPEAPAPAAFEDPADVEARVRYERAVRADYDGRQDDAVREAQSCIEAKPDGRFAVAARTLIARLHGEPAGSSVGPRTELIITGTFTGLYLSSLLAGAFHSGAKEGVALLMIGTGGALFASVAGSKDRQVPQSMPQMLENGVLFGIEASLLGYALADSNAANILSGVAAGAFAGAAASLIASPFLTGGDSGAVTAGILFGGGLPVLLAGAAQGRNQSGAATEWAALIGSSAGLLAGPLLNQRLHFSRGRWNLISLGGGVGALMGGGIAVLSDSWSGNLRAGFLLTAVGSMSGLALATFLTDGFGADEPRPGSAAVLHLEEGKVSLGSLAGAIAPARLRERTVPLLQLIDGRF